jgi:hypothetical protein
MLQKVSKVKCMKRKMKDGVVYYIDERRQREIKEEELQQYNYSKTLKGIKSVEKQLLEFYLKDKRKEIKNVKKVIKELERRLFNISIFERKIEQKECIK